MALLSMDSFDHYLTAHIPSKWLSIAASGAGGGMAQQIGAVGRRSSNGLLLRGTANTGNSGAVLKSLQPADNTVIVGAAVRWTGVNNNFYFNNESPTIFAVRRQSTYQLLLRLNSVSGIIDIYRGSTIIGGVSVPLSALTMTYIEMKAVIAPGTGGSVEIRFNGGLAHTPLTGVNTAGQGTASWDQVQLGPLYTQAGSGGVSMQFDYDDFYVCDGSGVAPWNNFLGDCRVDALLPTAEGALAQFAPLAGTDNALMVDDPTPDDDTTSVSSVTPGDTDTYVTPNMPVAGSGPTAIQLVAYAKKAAEGLAPTAGVVRVGGVNYATPLVALGTSYGYRVVPIMVNPATGLPFTEAEFNAAEFGFTRG